MPYTFVPKEKHAKVYGNDVRISTKTSVKICSVIRGKPLARAKRLLVDLSAKKRSLDGQYHTKTVNEILSLLESCEKNAEFLGLDNEKLFVHASAHKGTHIKRRRRKAAFGSTLKSTNVEIFLIERGKESKTKVPKKKIEEQKHKAQEAKEEKGEAK
jgi:ribosomal protein L22